MPDITINQGASLSFSIPHVQGILSAVTLALTGAATYPVTPGTLQTGGDASVQLYTWPDTSSLSLGAYTYSYEWTLNGTPQAPITGALTVVSPSTVLTPFDLQVQALALEVDAATEPVLSNEDLAAILTKSQGAQTWAPNTPYKVGQRVLPTQGSGFWYIVTGTGVSGQTEPAWPDPRTLYGPYFNFYAHPGSFGMVFAVTDGTVQLWCDGRAGSMYDLKVAARAAWLLKAARSAALVDTTLGSDKFAWSQVYKNCMDQAKVNTPFAIF